ncbi:hypothetical protein HPB47_016888, partial [Ixodes persulcatus]
SWKILASRCNGHSQTVHFCTSRQIRVPGDAIANFCKSEKVRNEEERAPKDNGSRPSLTPAVQSVPSLLAGAKSSGVCRQPFDVVSSATINTAARACTQAPEVNQRDESGTNDRAWALASDQSELTRVPPSRLRKICAKHCDFIVYCDCTAYDSLGVLQLFALELPESRIVFLLIFALQ